jgi:hypothetical protein
VRCALFWKSADEHERKRDVGTELNEFAPMANARVRPGKVGVGDNSNWLQANI